MIKPFDFYFDFVSLYSFLAHKEIRKIEKNFTFLATVGSTAPFIGLFGTVWGTMNSFQSIAISRNTSLAIVAPGIAEALATESSKIAFGSPKQIGPLLAARTASGASFTSTRSGADEADGQPFTTIETKYVPSSV